MTTEGWNSSVAFGQSGNIEEFLGRTSSRSTGRDDESSGVRRFRRAADAPPSSFNNGNFVIGNATTTVAGDPVSETPRGDLVGGAGSTLTDVIEKRIADAAARTAAFEAELLASQQGFRGLLADQAGLSQLIAGFNTPEDPFNFGQPLPEQPILDALPALPTFDNTPLLGVGTTESALQPTQGNNPAAAFAPAITTRAAGQVTTKPQGVGTALEKVLGARTRLENQGRF